MLNTPPSLKPLIYYHQPIKPYPNFGTWIWCGADRGFSKIAIWDWRGSHLNYKLYITYGVTANWNLENHRIESLVHGNALAIESPEGKVRYYAISAQHPNWDRLMMPQQAIKDWDENNLAMCFHFGDLYWYYPDYRTPEAAYKQMGKLELYDAVTNRIEIAIDNQQKASQNSMVKVNKTSQWTYQR